METSMYYTFSTIAQVLAAFIALSGVFVIFKLQDIKKVQVNKARSSCELSNNIRFTSTDKDSENVRKAFHKLERFVNSENVSAILKLAFIFRQSEFLKKATPVAQQTIVKNFDLILQLKHKQKRILRTVYTSVIIGLLTIMYCLITLSSVHCIHSSPKYLFLIGILGCFASMILMGVTIYLALRDINSDD